MFTSLSRFRREVAVLTVLSLVASVLVVAAPAAAADDPAADYPATFDACMSAPSAGFTDVPEGHANAGDIDCIAYYGITKGTSATTYSPLMSVSREHMALFLTRLATLVGIEVASDPADPGFTDDDALSAESQTAIAQLADLGITKGTSATTYSPAANVKRGNMALFIQRLMNKMDPMAKDKTKVFGYKPSQVVAVEDDTSTTDVDETKKIGSPFTDLGSATKDQYDAVTQLWELGVASGISDTAYSPASDMTRASMAGFMAALLDHSNARPSGLTIQATKTSGFGSTSGDFVISYRTDSFAAMADVSIKIFDTDDTGVTPFLHDGKCTTKSACEWSDSDDFTGNDGNIFETGTVATGDNNAKKEITYYAWMGDEDNTEFVKGSSGEASVTYTANPDALGIKVTTDINENAESNKVNMDKESSVVVTAQLVNSTEVTAATTVAVAKSGVKLTIGWQQGDTSVFPAPAAMKTDDEGKVTYTITGPVGTSTTVDDQDRTDTVSFAGDVGGTGDTSETGSVTVTWTDAAAAVTTGKATAPKYAIINDGEVRIKLTASYYDQYGNPAASGDTVGLDINNSTNGGTRVQKTSLRVRSDGTASLSGSVKAAASNEVDVVVGALTTGGIDADDPADVLAVRRAHSNDDGITSTVIPYVDDDLFIIDTSDRGTAYSYDSDDTFIVNKATVDMDAFETEIVKSGVNVNVVFYVVDGTSIFSTSIP